MQEDIDAQGSPAHQSNPLALKFMIGRTYHAPCVTLGITVSRVLVITGSVPAAGAHGFHGAFVEVDRSRSPP
jgi:hypothetical protein